MNSVNDELTQPCLPTIFVSWLNYENVFYIVKVPQTDETRYHVRAVSRALDVLVALSRSPQGTSDLARLAKHTGLHSSTVFRLLETLSAHDFVRGHEGGGYEIGALAFEVGSAFLRRQSLWQEANDLAERLASAANETASVGVLDSGEVLYVAIAHGQEQVGIQSSAGTRHPAYCTALGKVLLAALSWNEATTMLTSNPMPERTSNTIVSLEDMYAELVKVARLGYAVDDEERLIGIRCIGAPIRDHRGKVVAAISASGPAFRMQGEHFDLVREAVVRSAHAASRAPSGRVQPMWPAENTHVAQLEDGV